MLAAAEFVRDGDLSDTTIAGSATSISAAPVDHAWRPTRSIERDACSRSQCGLRCVIRAQILAVRSTQDPSSGATADRHLGRQRLVIWGDSDTVIWGDSDTVIWGDSDTVIWGDSDTVIWGDSDSVIWGDSDTVIWGDSNTVIWGDSDTVIWGD